jgi:hypothetical protein
MDPASADALKKAAAKILKQTPSMTLMPKVSYTPVAGGTIEKIIHTIRVGNAQKLNDSKKKAGRMKQKSSTDHKPLERHCRQSIYQGGNESFAPFASKTTAADQQLYLPESYQVSW